MIIDQLDNSTIYEQLNPLFAKAFDYLKSLDTASLEAGKTVLIEDELIVMINDSKLKSIAAAKLEVHDKYIDIQVPVSANEGYGWKARKNLLKEKEPFNPDKDIQFFEDEPDTIVHLKPGEFAIFFPEDGHAPCIGREGDPIRKIIVKVKAV